MNKQFFHYLKDSSKGGKTFCVELPDSTEFGLMILNNIVNNDPIKLKIGIAKCSDKDYYIKKLGRELSSNRLKDEDFDLIKVTKNLNKSLVVLYNNNLHTELAFQLNAKSQKVWLLYAD